MKPYRTLATVRLFAGRIGLTDDQVKWRAQCLSQVQDNIYEIISKVTFKAGEVIGLEDPPKVYMASLDCLEPEKPAKPAVIEEKAAVTAKVDVEVKPAAPKRRGRPAKKKV